MRTITSLLLSALVLCAGDGLAQTVGLQVRVARAVAHDLGIDIQDSSTHFGMQILGSEVQLPEQARLHVAAVHAVPGSAAWLLRLECGSRLECLPFEVVLRARGQEPSGLPSAPRRSSSAVLGNNLAAAPLVRAGQRVQLAEEVSGMRLSAPAVCLEAGSMGQRIRVRNVSSGRVVLARVRAAGQVAVED
jgi:hypothetical protein